MRTALIMDTPKLTPAERRACSIAAVGASSSTSSLLAIIERLTGERIVPADETPAPDKSSRRVEIIYKFVEGLRTIDLTLKTPYALEYQKWIRVLLESDNSTDLSQVHSRLSGKGVVLSATKHAGDYSFIYFEVGFAVIGTAYLDGWEIRHSHVLEGS